MRCMPALVSGRRGRRDLGVLCSPPCLLASVPWRRRCALCLRCSEWPLNSSQTGRKASTLHACVSAISACRVDDNDGRAAARRWRVPTCLESRLTQASCKGSASTHLIQGCLRMLALRRGQRSPASSRYLSAMSEVWEDGRCMWPPYSSRRSSSMSTSSCTRFSLAQKHKSRVGGPSADGQRPVV